MVDDVTSGEGGVVSTGALRAGAGAGVGGTVAAVLTDGECSACGTVTVVAAVVAVPSGDRVDEGATALGAAGVLSSLEARARAVPPATVRTRAPAAIGMNLRIMIVTV